MMRMPQFGDVLQLAYVPGDFREALRYWTEDVGAGPFFVREQLILKDWRYKGQPVDIDINVGIGYWGDIQIELIEQNCQTPSTYRTWRAEGREGLHHLGIDCRDAAAARAACARAGMEVVQEVDGPTGGIFYVEKPGSREPLLEFLCLTPTQQAYFAMMKEAHRTWDGSAPIR